MPAVVRGGRRQSGKGQPPRGAPKGRVADIGHMDMSPRVVAACLVGGVVILGAVLATGARAERITASATEKFNAVTVGMGLKINQVHVSGASPEAVGPIQRAVDLYQDQPIVSLDLNAVRERVEQVGWVKEARVVRLLPDTIIVDVKEHNRLAVWQMQGKAYVIDADGVVIPGADAGRYPDLPLVVGKGADQAASDIVPLLRQRPRLMSRVDALVRVDERRWDLRLKDGALIQLPAVDQDSALIRLDALDQRERLLDLGFARVDLRTPEEVAIRPSEGDA
ncbi:MULTISPECIES: cell division protein FtsQ/DivIB [unclassified Brevundimonas]|uniref:cell division protein FtsQ/DivIB n=1 Tax=unclassified Brevundimonas TaxID=2622653 RepID=UPI0025BE5102|nr:MULTISPECIES: cell division protein FtsQ/DivIB [unclassified Brevundimonas]